MKNLAVVIVVLGILAVAFYLGSRDGQSEKPAATLALPAPAEQSPEPALQHSTTPPPVIPETETAPVSVPLPELELSDAVIREALGGLYDATLLEQLFIFESAIRRFVVIMDNLTAAKLPQKFIFTRPPRDKFQVLPGTDGADYIDPANYERYTPYVRFIDTLDVKRTAVLYLKFYPLLQQAYVELGYPDRKFNDRVMEVVDNLLATPVVPEPIKLLRPKVYYTYADEDLEALSSGQKLMLRMGSANAGRIKNWLRRFRSQLAGSDTMISR